jgi:hypothetical protein
MHRVDPVSCGTSDLAFTSLSTYVGTIMYTLNL